MTTNDFIETLQKTIKDCEAYTDSINGKELKDVPYGELLSVTTASDIGMRASFLIDYLIKNMGKGNGNEQI